MLRLKTRAQFQAVLAGNRIASSHHFAVHYLAPDGPAFRAPFGGSVPGSPPVDGAGSGCWLGAMTPKRWAKRAVTRNTIKRQIYSVAREYESRLPAGAWLVRLRAGFDRALFHSASSTLLKADVRAELTALLARAAQGPGPKPLQGLAK